MSEQEPHQSEIAWFSLGDPKPRQGVEWRVVQRWPNGEELTLSMPSEDAVRTRQDVLDRNHSHPSQELLRRIEVIRIERRVVGPWETMGERVSGEDETRQNKAA